MTSETDGFDYKLENEELVFVVTTPCECYEERVISAVNEFFDSDGDAPLVFVNESYAESEGVLSDPTIENARTAFARALDDTAFVLHCDSCNDTSRMQSVMEGTTGTDDGNRDAVFLRGSTTLDAIPTGMESLALDTLRLTCPDCNSQASHAAVIQEGPEAPELGWEYCECPVCSHRWHVSATE